MLHQDRLRILLAVYERRLGEVAVAAKLPLSSASEIVNCRRPATPEQIERLEAAIVGMERRIPRDVASTAGRAA